MHFSFLPSVLYAMPISITLITFGEAYRLWISSLYNLLQPSATSSRLSINILLNTLFSNTLSLWSSLMVRDQVSCPYKPTIKTIVSNSLIPKFLSDTMYTSNNPTKSYTGSSPSVSTQQCEINIFNYFRWQTVKTFCNKQLTYH